MLTANSDIWFRLLYKNLLKVDMPLKSPGMGKQINVHFSNSSLCLFSSPTSPTSSLALGTQAWAMGRKERESERMKEERLSVDEGKEN